MISVLAKTRLETELLTNQVRSSKIAQKLVSAIVDSTRCMAVLQRDIEQKRSEIERLTASGQVKYAGRETDLMNLSMVILQLQDHEFGGVEADVIFREEEDPIIRGRRRTLGEVIQNLRFLYTFDPVSEINNEILTLVRQATPEWDGRVQDPLARFNRGDN